MNELKQTISRQAHLPGVREKEVSSQMSKKKSINELTSFHKTIKAEPFEDILYCEACKNLKGNFGEHSLD